MEPQNQQNPVSQGQVPAPALAYQPQVQPQPVQQYAPQQPAPQPPMPQPVQQYGSPQPIQPAAQFPVPQAASPLTQQPSYQPAAQPAMQQPVAQTMMPGPAYAAPVQSSPGRLVTTIFLSIGTAFLLLVVAFVLSDASKLGELKQLVTVYDFEGYGLVSGYTVFRSIMYFILSAGLVTSLLMHLLKKPAYRIFRFAGFAVGGWMLLDTLLRFFVLKSFFGQNNFSASESGQLFNTVLFIFGLLYVGLGTVQYIFSRSGQNNV